MNSACPSLPDLPNLPWWLRTQAMRLLADPRIASDYLLIFADQCSELAAELSYRNATAEARAAIALASFMRRLAPARAP